MIGEHDRTRMREEAERVMASHPLVSSDAHLMAVFVVTLLDDAESGGKSTRRELGEEEAARIAEEAVREVRQEMAAERSEGPLLPAPTPEEVRARRETRRGIEEVSDEALAAFSSYHERLYDAAQGVWAAALPLPGESGEVRQIVATRALEALNDVLCERFVRKSDEGGRS